MLVSLFAAAIVLQPTIEWSPYPLRAGNPLVEVPAELGKLKVPENSAKSNGKTVELAFVRLKSTSLKSGPPTVYLDGGPGSSAIGLASAPSYLSTFMKLQEVGDVILLDQRGVGRSRPNLLFVGGERAKPDLFESQETFMGMMKSRAVAAAEHFRKQGIDLESYNTAQIADDVDALRVALGAPKINIVGFSYGTHLGLSAIRRHGKNLNRAVLVGTEGPDMTNKMPMEVDRQFDRLQKLIDADPVWKDKLPDIKGSLRRLIARFQKEPVDAVYTPPGDGPSIHFKIGAFGLKHLILRDLGDARDHPWFPLLVYSLEQGDTKLLAGLANRRYPGYAMGTNLMTWLVDGASGTSASRAKAIAEEAKTALFGDDMNYDFGGAEIGGILLGDDFRAPVVTDVPTLFISGTLDWNTQPHQADEVRRTFRDSEHIVVENAGHESMLDTPPIAEQIVKFLRGGSTAGFSHRLDPPKFLPPP